MKNCNSLSIFNAVALSAEDYLSANQQKKHIELEQKNIIINALNDTIQRMQQKFELQQLKKASKAKQITTILTELNAIDANIVSLSIAPITTITNSSDSLQMLVYWL